MSLELTKIKTNKPNRFGASIIIANILVDFDKEGIAQVLTTDVSILMNSDLSLTLVDLQEDKSKENEPKKESPKEKTTELPKEKNPEQVKLDNQSLSKQLAKMELNQIHDFCEKNLLVKEDRENLEKLELIKYIINKIK